MTCEQCGQWLGRNEYFVVRCSGVVEVKCCKCKGIAGVWSDSYESKAQNEPTIIHRGPNGEVRFATSADAPAPPGFEKEELRTVREKDRFEREQNARENQKHADFMEYRERMYAQVESRNRSDLRSRMLTMSPLGRDLARAAMERSNQKARPRFDAGFFIEVNHNDAHNRSESSERTGWKRKKG